MNKKTFAENMELMSENFGKEMSETFTKLYWQRFKDMSDEAFKEMCLKAIDTLKWFPKIAELKELVQIKLEDRALIAWHTLINSLSYYQSVCFEDRVINTCVNELGGWLHLCSMSERELNFKRKEFLELYKIYSKSNIEHPKKLVGYFEQHNRAHGFLENIPGVTMISSSLSKVDLELLEDKTDD